MAEGMTDQRMLALETRRCAGTFTCTGAATALLQLANDRTARRAGLGSSPLRLMPLAACALLNTWVPTRAFSGARHRAGWQLRDVCRDLTWPGQPDLVSVTEDVLNCTSQLPQPEWLTQDKGVQHEWAYQ